MIKNLALTLFVILPAISAAPMAAAQDLGTNPLEQEAKPETGGIVNQYDPKYRPALKKPVEPEKETIIGSSNSNIIPVQEYGIYFIREPNSKPNEARLRISLPIAIDGCLEVEPPKLKIKNQPPYLRGFITPPVIKMDKSNTSRYSGCLTSARDAYVDMIIDPEFIIKNEIKKISLRDGTAYDTYTIHLDSQKILLSGSAETFEPQFRPNKSNPLEYWFYPENTVILSAQGVDDLDPEVLYEEVKKLANANNLISLETVLTDFGQNNDGTNRFYFVDETGRWPRKIGKEFSVPFGQIKTAQGFTGIEGQYGISESYNVYARKPSYYD